MARAPNAQQGTILKLLAYAEKSGIHAGGLCLIVLGLYGGQYAKQFPDSLTHIAGWFCLSGWHS
jgi:hypothetical protein